MGHAIDTRQARRRFAIALGLGPGIGAGEYYEAYES